MPRTTIKWTLISPLLVRKKKVRLRETELVEVEFKPRLF